MRRREKVASVVQARVPDSLRAEIEKLAGDGQLSAVIVRALRLYIVAHSLVHGAVR